MKREIKFRGFGSGKWRYGYYVHFDEKPLSVIYNPKFRDFIISQGKYGEHAIPVDTETIGQFTGVYDKNSKEIYEGDILLWHTMYLVVEWRQEDCRYVLVGCHDNEYVLNAYKCNIEDDFEVIGNIYDNKEQTQI